MYPKRVAIVAEWLTWRGGGESVLDELLEIYPEAKLFTTVYNAEKLPEYKKYDVKTSFLQKIPFVNKKHQLVPPLLLKAIESLDLNGFDLIISLSSAIGKGIKKPVGSVHVCYCHTPMRYVWQSEIDNRLTKIPFGKYFINYLKQWDLKTNLGVDFFIANSANTSQRIKKFYKRESTVINPPVKIIKTANCKKKNFYLCLGRLIPYKRIDLAVQAFNENGEELLIAGDGPELRNLKKIAKKNIKFLGRVSNKQKYQLIRETKALIFPGEEDFGIVPVEAISQATPVIAYARGGAKEILKDGITGILFESQDKESIAEALKRFERTKFKSELLVEEAKKFSSDIFQIKIKKFIKNI
ncbi:MAG: GDP-mannose-dependent alpha-(1-6)-phosphatidylinositol monomannoside mannosyltransferase [candidate division WS2 bacterium ADurb.Bin280]|uniref:GDP-mannose-dependent alpha-(1-6)-phosphatidylinositol monomannoside mannosyltransferase n=1 Tax=candidate division WS2 bacterium ADurb.Bin280 TaxID=1852829 RepID=A0A1V5SFR5_9BACT|nr:MAG: GDP-mannose-dependent alpha-(1-6)-phosphatidylinositol monomannoside mannosyltransferase [candidate division WS2 bacterium ADurb.Bin280]